MSNDQAGPPPAFTVEQLRAVVELAGSAPQPNLASAQHAINLLNGLMQWYQYVTLLSKAE